MAPTTPNRWGALVAFLFGRLFVAIGLGAWGFILYQLYELAASAMSAPGFRDPGSNNLGAGIGWLVLIGLVLLGAVFALVGALITREFTHDPDDVRILRFAALINGSLLAFTALAILAVSIFLQ